jgi:thioredoxin 1
MTDGIIDITKENFKQEVLQSQLPVLLDFWGPRCIPCKRLMPIFEELAEDYAGKVKFCKINTSENRSLTQQFNVMSIPTLHFYKDGSIKRTLRGAVSREEIEEQLTVILD